MLKKLMIIIFLIFYNAFPQSTEERTGTVTYLSSQNVYVKFETTKGIITGDTLFVKDKSNNFSPVIIIKYISSRSCAGELINGEQLKTGDLIFAFAEKVTEDITTEPSLQDSIVKENNDVKEKITEKKYKTGEKNIKKNFYGRISVQSFSNFGNYLTRNEYQRWRYNLSFNTQNIGGSSLSLESYLNYSYKANEWQEVKNNPAKSLRIYNLAFNYSFHKTNIWLGRHINRKASNISAVDGIQIEQSFNDFYAGAIAGSRPDFSENMGINLKLFEYGIFIGRSDTINNRLMESTLGIFQQTNDFKTDRRFLYLQHTNSIIPKVNLFLSSEVDLFRRETGKNKNDFSFTSIFFSTRYAHSRVISFSLSYDARRNVIYYETFKTLIDSIIERETRQGVRFGTNIRPFNNLFIGLNAGYRFQKSDLKPSRNFNGYLTYSNVPYIDITPSINYTKIISSYTDGSVWGVSFTKSIFDYSSVTFEYRKINYKFLFDNLNQSSFTINFSSKILDNFYLTAGFEGIYEKAVTYNRFLADFSIKF